MHLKSKVKSERNSKKFDSNYWGIIMRNCYYVYGRQVGISRGSVGIGRSQVGTDRY